MKDFTIKTTCFLCDKESLTVENNPPAELMQCLYCGYSTTHELKNHPKKCKKFKTLDEKIQKWSVYLDKRIWIPSILSLNYGLVYPIEDEEVPWKMKWAFAPLVDVSEEDREKYTKPDGSYYKQRYDIDNQIIKDYFYQILIEINKVNAEENHIQS
tara:strand:- start:44093 stop:44560 length:468 start_codon:yes stop_codon:yes gene_type:complete